MRLKKVDSMATITHARQPDIGYSPDFEKYTTRTKVRLQTEPLLEKSLPPGFPPILESDLVWEGNRLAEKYDWTFVLTAEHVKELENALEYFQCE